MKKFALLACVLLGCSVFAISGAVTIDFETDGMGNPTFTGEEIGNIYANLGVTFLGSAIGQCRGGCPPPADGHFAGADSPDAEMTLTFNMLQPSVTFDNVSFSFLLATAYDSMGHVLSQIDDETGGTYDTLTLTGPDIAYIVFQDDGQHGGFGIDDLIFSSAAPVSEPGSLFLIGSGVLGAAMRRK